MRRGPTLPLANLGHPLNQGLVGWWMLHRSMGGGALMPDISGRGGHGVLTSGATWEPGTNGFRAVKAGTASDYVSLAASADSGKISPGEFPYSASMAVSILQSPAAFDITDILVTGFCRLRFLWATGGKAGAFRGTIQSGGGFSGVEVAGSLNWTLNEPIFVHWTVTAARVATVQIRSKTDGYETANADYGAGSFENGARDCTAIDVTGGTSSTVLHYLKISRGLKSFDAEYDQFQPGFPDTLVRARRSVGYVAAAPAGGSGPLIGGRLTRSNLIGGKLVC